MLLVVISCTNTNLKNKTILKVTSSNEIVPVLIEAWDQQNFSMLEKKIGAPTKVEKNDSDETLISYNNPENMSFPLLTIKLNKMGEILSIYYLITETNPSVSREWLLNKYINLHWNEKKLSIFNSHEVVQKILLWNDERKISAGYIDRFRNNQIEYFYFDKSGDNYKNKILFFYE